MTDFCYTPFILLEVCVCMYMCRYVDAMAYVYRSEDGLVESIIFCHDGFKASDSTSQACRAYASMVIA